MTPCASPQQLEQLVNDQLEASHRETIAVHVEHCAACQQVLERLTHDTVRQGMPAADRGPTDPQTELLQFLKVQGPLLEEEATRVVLRADADEPARRPRAQREAGANDRPAWASGSYPAIAGFRILREIGRGGMGVVYEAEQEVLSRRVALKVLPPHARVHPTQLQRFEREAKAAARLHHTNIVPIFGVGAQDGFHYYVMQYIEGSGLDLVLYELRQQRAGPGPDVTAEIAPSPDRPRPPDADRVANPGCARPAAADLAHSLATGRFGEPEPIPDDRDADSSRPEPGPTPDPGSEAGSTVIVSPGESPVPVPPAEPSSLALEGSGSIPSPSASHRLFFRSVARIGLLVAEALEYAHRQGILHRDIKPSNLLLDLRGNVWITDFGLAKTPGADDLTETGDVVGTIRYLAPERFQGLCDPRSDVYSLGLTLYELASLRPAYDELDRYRLMDRVRRAEPARLRTRVPRIPRDLETIIHTAIAREPARRYARAADLAADLRRFLEGRPILARRASLLGRFARWCRRNPWVAGLSAAVFLSLILGTIASTVQAIRATRAEAAVRDQRDRAETQVKISTAVQEFLRQDLLSQASAYNQSTRLTRPDPDLKVRTALDRAAQTIGDRFADQPLVEASIRQTVGETYHQLGLYRESLPHLQRALQLRRRALGPDDPDTLLAMKSLGALYLVDDKFAEAEPLLVGALKGLQKGDPRRPELLDAMAIVADLDFRQGKLAEAEHLLARARAANLSTRGEDDPKTLDVTANLGQVYLVQGKSELAERTLADVLDRSQRSLGFDHPFTSVVKQCLAEVYRLTDRPKEATQLLIEVIAAQTKVLGRQHPETLSSLVSLGSHYVGQDIHDKAEPLLTEALAGCRAALDRNHETTDAALAGLAAMYAKKRDMKRVGQVLIEAAEITRLRWGAQSGYTMNANLSAGTFLLLYQREYARAEPYLRDYLAARAKDDPGREARYFAELQFGLCLLAQRKYHEAQSHLLIGYNGMRAGRDHLPPLEQADLGWLIEQVYQLRGTNGERLDKGSVLSRLLQDPAFQGIVLDLQFPAEAFAPP